MSYYPKRTFSKEAWITEKETRYELTDDIIAGKVLIGKTKAEVRSLLGDSENVDESNDWSYDIGIRPEFFNIDDDWLEIEFKKDVVVKVSQLHR